MKTSNQQDEDSSDTFKYEKLVYDNFEISDIEPISTKEPIEKPVGILGLILMLIGLFFMNLCMIFIKKVQQENDNFTIFEIVVIRGLFQTLLQPLVMYASKTSFKGVSTYQYKLLIARSSFSCIATYLCWGSFGYLPMGLFSIIFNLGPIITVVFAFFMVDEKLKVIEIINTIVAFIGLVLVISFSQRPKSEDYGKNVSPIVYGTAIFLCFIGTVLTSGSAITVRKLKEVHWSIINTFYGLFLLIVGIVMWFFCRYLQGNYEYNFTSYQWTLIILLGIFTTISNQLVILAFSLDKLGRVHSLFFLLVVCSYFEDVFLFNHRVRLIEVLGALIIVMCSISIFVLKALKITK